MKTIKIIKLVLTICFLSTLIYLPACQKKNANTNKEIIDNLQKNIPFTIITPTYFPVGINPVIGGVAGPSVNKITNSTSFGLFYYGKSDDMFIWLSEENREIIPVPNEPSSILVIKNVQILEEFNVSLNNPKISTNNINKKDVLAYSWNQDGVYFDVSISGYEKVEARKIIESMIK